MVEIYLPRRWTKFHHRIPPQFPGDIPTIVMDHGTLDGHQLEEITQKVQEDAQDRLKRQGGRFRAPVMVTITRFVSKNTRRITKYILEYKRDE